MDISDLDGSSTRAVSSSSWKNGHIDVRGVRLRYIDGGTGPAIVLFHGNGMSAQDFVTSGLFDKLSAKHRVVAFDRPGFGGSTRPISITWSATEQAALFHEAFEQLGIVTPAVVGHSWGALVAVALALDFPDDVRSLVLLAGYYFTTPRASTLGSAAGQLSGTSVQRSAVTMLRRLRATTLGDIGWWYAHVTAAASEAALMNPSAGALEHRYAELTMPVVLVGGTEDSVVDTLDQSARLAETVRGARLHIVQNCGHMVHHEAVGRVAEAVCDALKRAS